jgi:hypothetical protein
MTCLNESLFELGSVTEVHFVGRATFKRRVWRHPIVLLDVEAHESLYEGRAI